MGRIKRSRKKHAMSSIEISPQFILSVIAFIISVVIFISQCIIPLRPPSFRTYQSSLKSKPSHNYESKYSYSHSSHPQYGHKSQPVSPPVHVATTSNNDTNNPIPTPITLDKTALENLEKIPKGPYPLPPLSSSFSSPTKTLTKKPVEKSVQAGSTWTVSLARGLLPTLPAHWAAEVSRAASAFAASLSSGPGSTSYGSIFTARRKGDWIGCSRTHNLICKGVYRGIKAQNTLSVLSLTCDSDMEWLPHILRKLRSELRPVRLYCGLPYTNDEEMNRRKLKIEELYKDNGLSGIVGVKNIRDNNNEFVIQRLNDEGNMKKKFKVDMMIIYRLLGQMTLIDGIRFLRAIKKSEVSDMITSETFTETDNSVSVGNGVNKINVGTAPYLFPAPVFEYINGDDDDKSGGRGGGGDMEIVVVKVNELFEENMTPEMKDLIDPRKRVVLE